MRREDVDCAANQSSEVGQEDAVPALNGVVWKDEIAHSQDVVGDEGVVRRAHRKHTYQVDVNHNTYVQLHEEVDSPISINQPVT